jgi:hypothetical protein
MELSEELHCIRTYQFDRGACLDQIDVSSKKCNFQVLGVSARVRLGKCPVIGQHIATCLLWESCVMEICVNTYW